MTTMTTSDTRRVSDSGRLLGRMIVRRLLAAVLMLFVVSLVVFVLTQALPGDVVRQMLGQSATADQVARLRAELGLDQPLIAQYLSWAGDLLHGDLGVSLTSGEQVSTMIGSRLGATASLVVVTFALMVPCAFVLGIAAARRPGGVIDHVVSGAVTVILSLPEFVVGILLIVLLATGAFRILPPTSVIPAGQSLWQHPQLLILPVLTLVVTALPYLTESVKSAMRDELGSEYIRWARLSGIRESRLVIRHALRNALAPSLQVSAMTLTYLLGGTVAIEVVFNYPGIGSALVSAVTDRDVPVVQGIVMIVAAASLVVYVVADLLALIVTPRARRRAQ